MILSLQRIVLFREYPNPNPTGIFVPIQTLLQSVDRVSSCGNANAFITSHMKSSGDCGVRSERRNVGFYSRMVSDGAEFRVHIALK